MGLPARRHIKAELQSVPAAALCFCFAPWTQRGGRRALVVRPSRPLGASYPHPARGRAVLVPGKLEAAQRLEADVDVLDLNYNF